MASFAVVFMLTIMFGAVLFVEMSPPTRGAGDRIINGKPALPRQFPFMAYVHSEEAVGKGPRLCGGSLITRAAVLTAPWCVYEHKKYTVRLGSIYRTEEDSNAWTVVSRWAVLHNNFTSTNRHSNVAIIYLPEKAPINDYIDVVELPSSPDMGSFLCCHGVVAGWGGTSIGPLFTEELRWTDVIVVHNVICEEIMPDGFVSDRTMCAGSYTSAVYEGDDGGPLVIKKPGGRFLQIGIHVYRDWGNFNVSKPALYARLTYFLEWIREKTTHGKNTLVE